MNNKKVRCGVPFFKLADGLWPGLEAPGFQLAAGGGTDQYRAMIVPVTEDGAYGGLITDGQLVYIGPVGMAMDHCPYLVLSHYLHHFFRGDIHNILLLHLVGHTAVAAQLVTDFLAVGKWQAEEKPLDEPAMYSFPVTLVVLIQGAQGITVQDQGRGTIKVNDRMLRQELDTGFLAKALADQKITVTMNEIAWDAGVCELSESRFDLLVER